MAHTVHSGKPCCGLKAFTVIKDNDYRPHAARLRELADDVIEAEEPTGTRPHLPRRGGFIDEILFPIVGVGASAGGLEAFSQLLQHLPSDTGMAFVLIQHLERTHVSVLAEHLAKLTTMRVQRVETGATVQPNHVYVIPNEADVTIVDGRLMLVPRDPNGPGLHLPVNLFLNALAAERGSYAVGVVLSGRAHDGTEGLRAIKAADGLTFAQDPSTARYPDMPQSALDARVVDHCLAIPALVQELARLTKHPYLLASPNQPRSLDAAFTRDVFDCIKLRRGIDFNEYKAATLKRRLVRRMVMRGLEHSAYLSLLQNDAAELDALCDDLLIHVTSFFRNPDVFEALKSRVFAELFARKPPGAPLRFWIAGCSTGEEVYSLAITLLEFLDGVSLPVQICGSDLSERAIAYARAGHYPDRALRDVSVERRQALLQEDQRRLSNQGFGSKALHLRAPRSDARSTVFEDRSGELSQRPDLLRITATKARARHAALRARRERLSVDRPAGEHRHVQRTLFGGRQGQQGIRPETAAQSAPTRSQFPAPRPERRQHDPQDRRPFPK